MNVEYLVIWRSPVFSAPDTWRRGITLCLSQQRGFSERWNRDWSLRKGDRCAAPRASSQGHREVIDQRMMAVINVTPFPATAVPHPPDTTPPSCRHKTGFFFFSLSQPTRYIYNRVYLWLNMIAVSDRLFWPTQSSCHTRVFLPSVVDYMSLCRHPRLSPQTFMLNGGEILDCD